MKRVLISIIPIFVMSLLAFGQKKAVEEIVARVNGDIILRSELEDAETDLRRALSQQLQGPQLEQAVAQRKPDLLRDLIDTSLLLQQAAEMGLNADLEVVKNMESLRQEYKFETMEALEKAIVEQGMTVDDFKQNIRKSYLRQQVIGREVYPKIIVSNEEMRTYYEAHKQEFDKPAGLQVREILIATEGRSEEEKKALRAKADEALAAVNGGEDFGEVAQKYSDAPSAQSGGQLGFFEKGQMTPQLEEVLYKLNKGQVTEVLDMPYGFHILKLEDKHEGGVLSFELAQETIQDRIWQQRAEPKIREYLTKLRQDGFVEIRDGYVDTGSADKPAEVSKSTPPNN